MSKATEFDYILNRFEHASQADHPADYNYGDHRRALFAYVRGLEAKALDADRAQRAAPVSDAKPVAWRRVNPLCRYDYIEHEDALDGMVSREWRPLYAAAQPVAVQTAIQSIISDIRSAVTLARRDYLFDKLLVALESAQSVKVQPSESGCIACAACGYPAGQAGVSCVTCEPVEVQRVGLTDEQISLKAHNEDAGDWNSLQFRDCWHGGFEAGFRACEEHHGIKPAGEKGGV